MALGLRKSWTMKAVVGNPEVLYLALLSCALTLLPAFVPIGGELQQPVAIEGLCTVIDTAGDDESFVVDLLDGIQAAAQATAVVVVYTRPENAAIGVEPDDPTIVFRG